MAAYAHLRASGATWHHSGVRLFCVLFLLTSVACGGADMPPVSTTDSGTKTSTGSTAFLEPCSTNTDCISGLCFTYNEAAIGKRCSKTCMAATAATDCPAPSAGCNGMGVCKHP